MRDHRGRFFVLEDNLRVPSGVSYMVENREITKRAVPELFRNYSILPVDDYPLKLYEMLSALSPRTAKRPNIVVLTPGIYNSAYFEHAFLAQGMGTELVEGTDLTVGDDDCVYMRTVDGPVRVDVIYRRIDEDFMDPEAFRSASVLGVPGLMRAWRSATKARTLQRVMTESQQRFNHTVTAQGYIDIYQKMLQRPLVQENFNNLRADTP